MSFKEIVKGKETGDIVELAGVVIRNSEGKLLLIHRKESDKTGPARYETIGGGLEEGETAEMAAEREALEEAELKVRVKSVLGRATFIENGITFGYTWFEAEIVEGKPRVGEDKFDGIEYFSWEQMDGMRDQLSPNTINLLDAHQRGEII